jgi:threonine dehydrogenase-like Zn-dependent dehydrogenase
VLGLGTIGQQVAQTLKAMGAARVIGVDVSALRLAAASKLGAETVDGSAGLAPALAPVLGDGEEIDLAFECSGVPTVANGALEQIRPGGTIVVLALYDDAITFNPTVLVQKEIRLQGSIAYTGEDFSEAVALVREGKVQAGPLITQRHSLDAIAQAFEVQLDKDRSLKVLVTPTGD